jgi:hypothetical protein
LPTISDRISALEECLTFNPDNEQVIQLLEKLRASQNPALSRESSKHLVEKSKNGKEISKTDKILLISLGVAGLLLIIGCIFLFDTVTLFLNQATQLQEPETTNANANTPIAFPTAESLVSRIPTETPSTIQGKTEAIQFIPSLSEMPEGFENFPTLTRSLDMVNGDGYAKGYINPNVPKGKATTVGYIVFLFNDTVHAKEGYDVYWNSFQEEGDDSFVNTSMQLVSEIDNKVIDEAAVKMEINNDLVASITAQG